MRIAPPAVNHRSVATSLSFLFLFLLRLISVVASQIGCLPYFYTWCGPSATLVCRSEMCCTRLAGNAGPRHQKFAIWAPSHNLVGLYPAFNLSGEELGFNPPHWLKMTPTLVTENFGLGGLLRAPQSRSSKTNITCR